MKTICIFDTATISRNTGDQVIMESVQRELESIFPHDFFVNIPTHDFMGPFSYHLLRKCHLKFVGGTNLLSSNMPFYNQWMITPLDIPFIKNSVLMGVGWWQYQSKPNAYTSFLLKHVLHPTLLHAVRDEYTKKQLSSIGITNVINTSCPSMWQLTPTHCKRIPKVKAKEVVVTLTVTHHQLEVDKQLVELLLNEYEKVWFWPQQPEDMRYFEKVAGALKVSLIDPTLNAFDRFLDRHKVDYVGTRLHGGVRALQKYKRSLILAIDNRATEISQDTNLPVIQRDNLDAIQTWINSREATEITLPTKNIALWKSQLA